ncbi:MAG: hypothetical protein LAO05_07380 [Acidobacteriia bacterium]|nr:hypothetical protein [Terriglobia bacterium]
MPEKPPGPPAAEDSVREAGASEGGARVSRVLAGALLLLVIATVWGVSRPAVDTFIGLAGGRDVFQGKLGKPDDWAFTTSGRVWLNQNWGFDAVMYVVTKAAGEGGLLALKALMILAIAGVAIVTARVRGAGWLSALLVTAAAMAGTRQYMELRANQATYLLACLLLLILYKSHGRPRLVWTAVPLIAVWANFHGGFMLGLALLGLWLGAGALCALRIGGIAAALRESTIPAAVLAASVAVTGLLSPFGLANLTYPFTYVSSPEWRDVTEWQPVSFTADAGATSAWELVVLVGLAVCTTVWRVLRHRHVTEVRETDGNARLRFVIFDAGLVILITWMGLSAIRFLPLALVLLTPLAAAQADILFRGSRPWVPTAIGATAVVLVMLPFAIRVAAIYSAGNPRFIDETVFQRMTSVDKLPSGAADFLQDNDVGGRVFSEWTFEGYLRWRCPQLRLFIGGRATQIYTLETLHAYGLFGADPEPAARLAEWDTHLVVVPLEREYLHIVDRIAFAEGAHWALVFYDGRTAVLADLESPPTRALAERVAAGRASFRRGQVALLSETLCRISSGSAVDAPALSRLAEANTEFPTAGGPWFLLFAARAHRVQPRWVVHTFEAEYERLTRVSGRSENRLALVQARLSIAQILANLYGRGPQATRWHDTREDLLLQMQAIVANP